jgi:hypothetical protein
MPTSPSGEQFADKNRNGYPDNFEAEETAIKAQFAQRRAQYGKNREWDNPLIDDDTGDVMEMKNSVFEELFGLKKKVK